MLVQGPRDQILMRSSQLTQRLVVLPHHKQLLDQQQHRLLMMAKLALCAVGLGARNPAGSSVSTVSRLHGRWLSGAAWPSFILFAIALYILLVLYAAFVCLCWSLLYY